MVIRWARTPPPQGTGDGPPLSEPAPVRPEGRQRGGPGSSRDSGRALGITSLASCGVCVLLTVVLGLLGPSSAEPRFGPAGDLPPWFRVARPSAVVVFTLVAVVLLLGTAAIAMGLRGVRGGWCPSPRALFAGGGAAVAGMLCVPPLGTTDPLNYAAFGRMAALGLDPYRVTPLGLAQRGDPVGHLALAEPWLHFPSVYGPLVTGTEWAASVIGGTSMLRTVWLLAVLNGAAFLATGALLLRLAGSDPARRVRSQLLWTLNPLLWWNLVAGPHVDGLAALCVVAAFCALRRSGLATGLALAAATAVKLTLGLFALPLAWALRRDPRRLAAAAAAGVLLAAVAYSGAPHAIGNAARVSERGAVGSPWPLLQRKALVPAFGTPGAHLAVTALQIVLVAGLAVLLLLALPRAHDGDVVQVAARPALALAAAYLLGSAYVRPWYDAAAWLLVALLPRSWFDGVLLAHTTLMTLPFDPGLPGVLHPHWLNVLVLQIGHRVVPASQTLLLFVVIVVCLRRVHAGRQRRTGSPHLSGAEPAGRSAIP
jgi:hypothetical protein